MSGSIFSQSLHGSIDKSFVNIVSAVKCNLRQGFLKVGNTESIEALRGQLLTGFAELQVLSKVYCHCFSHP